MRDKTTKNIATASPKILRLRQRPRKKSTDLAGILEGERPYYINH